MKEKKTAYYEPLMELINKKKYNDIWNTKIIKEITYNIGKKIHHNMISFLIDDGVYYRLEDTYADIYFILVKCVDTYKPYKNDKFINFKTFYITNLTYLQNYVLTNSTLFRGERYIKTDEGTQKREFTIRESFNTTDSDDKMNPLFINLVEYLDTNIEEQEITKELINLINGIEHLQTKKVLTMILEGKNQYEMAPVLGVSQARVNRIIRDIGDLKFKALTKQDIKNIEDIFKLFNKDIYVLSAKKKRRKRKQA